MSSKIQCGIVKVTSTFLENLLMLPEGHHIEAVCQDAADFYTRNFRFRIIGPLMPEVREGEVIPEVLLEYKQDENGQKKWKFDKVVFHG